MSTKTYYLGGVDISALDVINLSWITKEEKSLVGEDLSRFQDLDVELLNDDSVSRMFDPNEPTSIFYGREPWDLSFTVKDDDDETIYSGKVKTISVNYLNATATITVISDFNVTLDKTLEYYEDVKTPGEAFYEVMVLNGLGNLLGWNWIHADFLEDENDLFCTYTYQKSDAVTIYNALTEWANLAGADFFISQGQAEMVQYNPDRFVNPSITIELDDIIGQPVLTYDNDNIINQYSIETQAGTLTDEIIGADSRAIWGELSASSISVTNTGCFSSSHLVGLQWAGENQILRNQNPKQYIEFQLMSDFKYRLSLMTTFRFHSEVDDHFGEISGFDWEIVSFNLENDLYTIKAVKI